MRRAERRDLASILDIYNEAVLNSTATFDTELRTMNAHQEWVRQFNPPFVLLVADQAGEVVGWACLHPFGAKPGYRYTAEDSVYVRWDRRGAGIGRLLLQALVEHGQTAGFRTIIARIAGDNPASERLHESLGFRPVGVEREVGYKFGRWLDVVVLQRMLEQADEPTLE